jgi:hypothetical protein
MIQTRTFPMIALALCLLTLSATAQKSEAPAPDYFPLRVGDSWTYHSTTTDSQYSLKVASEEKQDDGTIRYLVEKLAGAKVLTWFSKTGDAVLMHLERYTEHEGLEMKYEPAKPFLKNPLVAGSQWGWTGQDVTQTDLEEDNQVTGPEDVTVPAGKFRAMKVVTKVAGTSTPMIKTTWYADGVGLVKSTTEGGQIKYGFELTDYSFKKKK